MFPFYWAAVGGNRPLAAASVAMAAASVDAGSRLKAPRIDANALYPCLSRYTTAHVV